MSLLNGSNFADWWTDIDLLNPPGETNHLRAEVVGNTLALYINGQLAIEVVDDSEYALPGGGTGLVISFFIKTSEVSVDNFSVSVPQGE